MERTSQWKESHPPGEGPPPEMLAREWAKAAKLRRKAATLRARGARLQDHARILFERAAGCDARADRLDGGLGRGAVAPREG